MVPSKWLLRAARWVRNPPSEGRVKLVIGVVVLCFVLLAIEQIWGWPEALTVNRLRR